MKKVSIAVMVLALGVAANAMAADAVAYVGMEKTLIVPESALKAVATAGAQGGVLRINVAKSFSDGGSIKPIGGGTIDLPIGGPQALNFVNTQTDKAGYFEFTNMGMQAGKNKIAVACVGKHACKEALEDLNLKSTGTASEVFLSKSE